MARRVRSAAARIAVPAILCVAIAHASCFAGVRHIDGAAQEYVRLVLALATHDPDLVDSYTGPPAWREDARAGSPSLENVIARADRLVDTVAAWQEQERAVLIGAQAAAIARRARLLRGDRISIAKEASALGLAIPRLAPTRVTELHGTLDASLPGSEPLRVRVGRAIASTAVPRSRLEAHLASAIRECRTRTAAAGGETGGRVDMRFSADVPWLAFTTNRGNGVSEAVFRRDALLTGTQWQSLACHETWPGHHAQYVTWERLRERGLLEFTVVPRFTPLGIAAERAAIGAASLVRAEDGGAAERALEELAAHAVWVAATHLDGGLPVAEALVQLRDAALVPNPESFLAFVTRYRTQAVAYVAPITFTGMADYGRFLESPRRLAAGR